MAKRLLRRIEFARLCGVSPAAVTKACSAALAPACSGKLVDVEHEAAVRYREDRARAQTPEPLPGIDPIYEQAVEISRRLGKFSRQTLQRECRVGATRADRVIAQMRAAGVLDKAPTTEVAIVPPGGASRPTPSVNRAERPAPTPRPVGEDGPLLEVPDDIEAFAEMTLRELIERFGTDTAFVKWLDATQKIEAINEKRLKNAERRGELVSQELVAGGVIKPIDGTFTRMLSDGAKTIASKNHAAVKAGASVADLQKQIADILGSFIRPAKNKMHRAIREAADSAKN